MVEDARALVRHAAIRYWENRRCSADVWLKLSTVFLATHLVVAIVFAKGDWWGLAWLQLVFIGLNQWRRREHFKARAFAMERLEQLTGER